MNNLKIFENEDLGKVRTIIKNGEPWFVAKDVSHILGYLNPKNAISDHVDNEDKLRTQIKSSGQLRNLTIINESGLYSLILRSKLPKSKEFKRWITTEILPSIRKTGAYMQEGREEEIVDNYFCDLDDETKISIVKQIKKKNQQLKKENEKLLNENNQLMHSGKLYTMSEIAKEIGMKSAQELNKFLKEKKIIYKRNGTWMPTSNYSDCKFFSIKQTAFENGITVYSSKVTQLGRKFILDLYQKYLQI